MDSRSFLRWCIVIKIIQLLDFVHRLYLKENFSETESISAFRREAGCLLGPI